MNRKKKHREELKRNILSYIYEYIQQTAAVDELLHELTGKFYLIIFDDGYPSFDVIIITLSTVNVNITIKLDLIDSFPVFRAFTVFLLFFLF